MYRGTFNVPWYFQCIVVLSMYRDTFNVPWYFQCTVVLLMYRGELKKKKIKIYHGMLHGTNVPRYKCTTVFSARRILWYISRYIPRYIFLWEVWFHDWMNKLKEVKRYLCMYKLFSSEQTSCYHNFSSKKIPRFLANFEKTSQKIFTKT